MPNPLDSPEMKRGAQEDACAETRAREPRAARRFEAGAGLLLLAGIAFFWAFAGLEAYRPLFQTVHGNDPVGYYSWVHSLCFDGDLDFENEYRALNRGRPLAAITWANPDAPRTRTGRLPNYFAMGPGLLWAPFLGAAHVLARDLGGARDGFSQPYHMAVFLALTCYGLAGLLLMYAALRTWFGQIVSAVAALGAWGASPALYYTFPLTASGHACSLFAVSLFLLAWARLRERDGAWAWACIGLTLGIAALVRWQDGAFAVLPALDLWARRGTKGARQTFWLAAGAAAGFAPQMIGWLLVFGTPLILPQGRGFMHWTSPDVPAFFFSRAYGLLTWTPFCGVAMTGLLFAPKGRRAAFAAMGAALLVQVYVNACLYETGWSFGMRRMVNCTPVFAAGFAALLNRFPGRRLSLSLAIVFAVAWNALTILQYAGFVDGVYVNRAFREVARQQGVAVETLKDGAVLPDGTRFDAFAVALRHCFPRGGGPSLRQLYCDKGLVLHALASRMLSLPPPE